MGRPPPARLAANLGAVRDRIARAAARAGRPPGAVRLVAVTKTVGADLAVALVGLGVRDLAENRVDALVSKMEALGDAGVAWHMIGHLQRNKVKDFLATRALLHSLDSLRLATAIAERYERDGLLPGDGPLRVLLEVNVSGEASKGGFRPHEVEPALERLHERKVFEPIGLMTMAPLVPDPEAARPVFRELRALRDRLAKGHRGLAELSMGMSNDFEVAIEEGATLVRVGSALFEGIEAGTA